MANLRDKIGDKQIEPKLRKPKTDGKAKPKQSK